MSDLDSEMSFIDSENDDEDYMDSDDELREALAKGLLKPGLNIIKTKNKNEFVNNEEKMKEKLQELMYKAPWIERLDLINDLAPLAPELAIQLERNEQKRANLFKGNKKIPYVEPENDPVLNDFKREMLFYRQAQTGVIEGIQKLHKANVQTKRPDDYFAEMAKSDEHMQKIRRHLMAKEEGMAKSERARQLREQRKMGKLIQRQATERRDEEKRKMLNDIKSFRKGKLKNLDFLEGDDDEYQSGNKSGGKKKGNRSGKGAAGGKRNVKDKKFGFGGRKRGSKRNTKESFLNDGPRSKNKGGAKKQRLGKNRRIQNKNRKR
uniref:Putative rrna-processing protein ebp2 n=1 Tax=Corethrella appendiculata TaxID=1370023 RepID=U5EZT4_9DIPT